jgi:hypothetical protein
MPACGVYTGGHCLSLENLSLMLERRSLVGASLLAMVVNDYASYLSKCAVFESIASRLAPTGGGINQKI